MFNRSSGHGALTSFVEDSEMNLLVMLFVMRSCHELFCLSCGAYICAYGVKRENIKHGWLVDFGLLHTCCETNVEAT